MEFITILIQNYLTHHKLEMYVITLLCFINNYYNYKLLYLFQEEDLCDYFRNQLHINDNQLFVVVTGDNNNWITSEDTSVDQQQLQSLDKR